MQSLEMTTAELINSFRKTELDSIRSYENVLEKESASQRDRETLEKILEEHREAARLLGEQAERYGASPVGDSEGDTDPMAALVAASGPSDADPFAVKALKAREEETILNYQNAVHRTELDPEVKTLVGSRLLDNARAHIEALDRILDQI